MRITRSMTRSMDQTTPKMKVSVPQKKSIIEFITEEELCSRNIDKNNIRCLNLVTVEKQEDMIRHHPSFEKAESKYIAENRIYAVVSEGYFWDSCKVYGGGCHCYYIKDTKN